MQKPRDLVENKNGNDAKWCSILVKMNLQTSKCIYIKVVFTSCNIFFLALIKRGNEMNVECIFVRFQGKNYREKLHG